MPWGEKAKQRTANTVKKKMRGRRNIRDKAYNIGSGKTKRRKQ